MKIAWEISKRQKVNLDAPRFFVKTPFKSETKTFSMKSLTKRERRRATQINLTDKQRPLKVVQNLIVLNYHTSVDLI